VGAEEKESLKPRLELGTQTHDALRPACRTSSAKFTEPSSNNFLFFYFQTKNNTMKRNFGSNLEQKLRK
jgi:hypothetical protein